MKKRRLNRIIIFVAVLLVIVLFLLFYGKLIMDKKSHQANEILTEYRLMQQHLQSRLDGLIFHHVDELNSHSVFHLNASRARINEFFKGHSFVEQVRVVDNRGNEIRRYHRSHSAANIIEQVAKNELQYKGGRYYVQEMLKMPVGAVYVSQIDLNIENGKVEIPLKWIVRVGLREKEHLFLINLNVTKIVEEAKKMGVVLASRDKQFISDSEFKRVLNMDLDKAVNYDFAKGKIFVRKIFYEKYPLGYMVFSDYKQKFDWIQRQFRLDMALYLVMIIGGIAFLYFLAQFFIKMEQSERLEIELASIGRTASTLIHEIKNMTMGVVMYPELIQNYLKAGKTEEVNEMLNDLIYSSQRLLHFTQNILNFVKGKDKMILNKKSVIARENIGGFIEHIKADPAFKDIEIQYKNGYEGEIEVDTDYCEHVLSNIFYNIEQATCGRCRVYVEDYSENGEYVLKIKNTNSWIPEGVKLFEFGQTSKKEGSGIGMYVSRLIVEANGGKIAGYNVDDGVVFEIRTPLS